MMIKKIQLIFLSLLFVVQGCQTNFSDVQNNTATNEGQWHEPTSENLVLEGQPPKHIYLALDDFVYEYGDAQFPIKKGYTFNITEEAASQLLKDGHLEKIADWEKYKEEKYQKRDFGEACGNPTFGVGDMTWTDPTSTELLDDCGETINTWSDMLDQVNPVIHLVSEVHCLVLDLGSNIDISRWGFKGYTTGGGAGFAPTDMDVYISTTSGTCSTGSWGTAVLTGVDTSPYTAGAYGDFIGTRKTGRYVKFEINGTSGGSPSFLSWGVSGQSMIRYWEGDIPKKYSTVIPLHFKNFSTGSTSYTPTNGSEGMLEWDGSKYNNITEAYLVATGKRTGSSGADPNPRWFMSLYDRSNAVTIGEVSSNGTSYETAMSADVSGNLPSGYAQFDVRMKHADSSSAQFQNFHLVIVQETEASGNKTRVYIPMASYKTTPLTIYRSLGNITGAIHEHQHKWLDANWGDTVSNAYFLINARALSGHTVTTKLDDLSQADTLATLTTTATVPTLATSTDFSSSLTDGSIYTPYIKTSATPVSSSDILYNAYMIVDITDVSKFVTMYDVGILGLNTTSAGWTQDATQLTMFLGGDSYYSSDVTTTTKHQMVAKHSNDTSMSVGLYDDNTLNTDSIATTTATSPTWLESGEITITDESDVSLGYNLASSGFLQSGTAFSSQIMLYISGLADAVARRIISVN